ncbi:hypothetical protein GCM10020000_23900 [Streptomyces olivoverticillatus]
MERRTIGAAALEVGAIGLGCMPMHWAYTASQQGGEGALRTVHAALDAGASLLDTADMYGPFTNELLVGRVLRERRSEAFVSTKCGLLVGDQHIVANGRPGYVKRACDASLRRLQTDVIDLYQLHRPDPEVPVEETWGAMAELVSAEQGAGAGLVRDRGARPAQIRLHRRGGDRNVRRDDPAPGAGAAGLPGELRAGGAVGLVAGGAGPAGAVVRLAGGGGCWPQCRWGMVSSVARSPRARASSRRTYGPGIRASPPR